MSMNRPTSELLKLARAGDQDAWGTLLEQYRAYLRFIAQRRMDPRLRARVDASDVVQQTFLEAARDLNAFRGEAEEEFVVWLRRILEHNVSEEVQKHLAAQKRTARREQSLDDSRPRGFPLRGQLASEQSTPSQRLMRGERAVQLARAVDSLPTDQCEAVRLRHFEGLSLKQLAEHFGRSETAVAGLLKRGLRGIRKFFAAERPQSRKTVDPDTDG